MKNNGPMILHHEWNSEANFFSSCWCHWHFYWSGIAYYVYFVQWKRNNQIHGNDFLCSQKIWMKTAICMMGMVGVGLGISDIQENSYNCMSVYLGRQIHWCLSSSLCSIHCERVGGNDPPFGSALGTSHRLTINEATPFKYIDSPWCPRTAKRSSSLQMFSSIISN